MKDHYHHYHTPPQAVSARVRCPVCHEEVYSRAGIHPQCAARRNDPPKVKDKEPTSPPAVGPVSVAIKAAEPAVILELPTAVRIFDPDRTPV